MEFTLAKKQDAQQVYQLVQETIRAVYPRYYLKEIVDMFCEYHSRENILKDIVFEVMGEKWKCIEMEANKE